MWVIGRGWGGIVCRTRWGARIDGFWWIFVRGLGWIGDGDECWFQCGRIDRALR